MLPALLHLRYFLFLRYPLRPDFYRLPEKELHRQPSLPKLLMYLCDSYLYIKFLLLFNNVFCGSHRQSHDRPGGVFITLLNKRTSIRYKQVFTIMCLAPFIEYRRTGIIPHPCGTDFVNDVSRWLETIIFFPCSHRCEIGRASCRGRVEVW